MKPDNSNNLGQIQKAKSELIQDIFNYCYEEFRKKEILSIESSLEQNLDETFVKYLRNWYNFYSLDKLTEKLRAIRNIDKEIYEKKILPNFKENVFPWLKDKYLKEKQSIINNFNDFNEKNLNKSKKINHLTKYYRDLLKRYFRLIKKKLLEDPGKYQLTENLLNQWYNHYNNPSTFSKIIDHLESLDKFSKTNKQKIQEEYKRLDKLYSHIISKISQDLKNKTDGREFGEYIQKAIEQSLKDLDKYVFNTHWEETQKNILGQETYEREKSKQKYDENINQSDVENTKHFFEWINEEDKVIQYNNNTISPNQSFEIKNQKNTAVINSNSLYFILFYFDYINYFGIEDLTRLDKIYKFNFKKLQEKLQMSEQKLREFFRSLDFSEPVAPPPIPKSSSHKEELIKELSSHKLSIENSPLEFEQEITLELDDGNIHLKGIDIYLVVFYDYLPGELQDEYNAQYLNIINAIKARTDLDDDESLLESLYETFG